AIRGGVEQAQFSQLIANMEADTSTPSDVLRQCTPPSQQGIEMQKKPIVIAQNMDISENVRTSQPAMSVNTSRLPTTTQHYPQNIDVIVVRDIADRTTVPILGICATTTFNLKVTCRRVERFMNYLKEQTDGKAMINSIKNGDQLLPRVTQVSIAGTTSTEQPPLKDKSMCNKTAKDLWDALVRHMLGSKYGKQDRKAAVLYEYETFKATEGELLLDTYIRYLQKKTVVVTSNLLALIAEKTNVSRSKEEVVVPSDSEGSEADDFSKLKKITALLAKAFNRRKFYSKPTNNNLRTSSSSQSANKKQEFIKTDIKKAEKKDDEKKRDMSKVKCYNCKKERHFAKDCKKAKVKDYEYYKIKMLLAKKDKDEQVLLAEDQAWMESSSDSDQKINANMVFMAQIEKVLSDFEASSSSADEKISDVSYYLSKSESESEFETL
nr:hypothetical protein [Tanacetum cinerariifolium]